MNSWWVGLDRSAFYQALHTTEARRIIRESEKYLMFDPIAPRRGGSTKDGANWNKSHVTCHHQDGPAGCFVRTNLDLVPRPDWESLGL